MFLLVAAPRSTKLRVAVTRRHIANGTRHSLSNCPIARALREMFPGKEITAWRSQVDVGETVYKPSRVAQAFMRRFDNGQYVPPLTMTLTLIPDGEPMIPTPKVPMMTA